MRLPTTLICLLLAAVSIGAAPPLPVLERDIDRAIDELRQGREAEGKKLLRLALAATGGQIKRRPEDAHLYFLKGTIHFHLAEDNQALEGFARAARMKPTVARYHFWQGLALLYGKSFNEAESAFEKAHNLDPKDQRTFFHYCDVKVRAHREQDGEACYRRLVGLFPNHARALFQLATLMGPSREEMAIKLYSRVLAIDPAYRNALFNMGQIRQKRGENQAAIEHFKTYLRLEPDDPDALAKLIQLNTAVREDAIAASLRDKLLSLHKQGRVPAARYCREQLRVNGAQVLVFEYFELPDPRAVQYAFVILSSSGEARYSVSLGSYKTTNDIARESGRIKGEERLWHLDLYSGAGHRTLAFYVGLPGYSTVRAAALAAIEKEPQPQ